MNEYKSKAHQTVYEKGVAAARANKKRKAPYVDSRGGKYDHVVTGARGYIKAWLAGYDSVKGKLDCPKH